ncbi:MAG: hypothetical protein OXG58_11175 [Gemmatimonadetes bacterium]|nr:hypothetical protein [Gemmatimonadota bacterium]
MLRGRPAFLPAANTRNIERLPREVRPKVELVPAETMDQVLVEALMRVPGRAASARGVDARPS